MQCTGVTSLLQVHLQRVASAEADGMVVCIPYMSLQANVLWAVAKLGFRPSYTLLQRYLFATYLAMPLMRAQELANLAWAAAHMRLHPGVDWLTRFYQTIHRQADSMRPQELANTAWALAQLAGDAGLTAASDAAVSPGSPQGAGVEPATSSPMATARDAAWLQLQRGMLRGLAGFKPSELMMALVALHGQDRLGWSGCNRQQLRELLCAAGPHLAAGAARMSQQDLCQCACILAWSVRGQGGGVHSNSWSTPEVQGGLRSVCSAIMQHTLHALPHLPFKVRVCMHAMAHRICMQGCRFAAQPRGQSWLHGSLICSRTCNAVYVCVHLSRRAWCGLAGHWQSYTASRRQHG